MNAPLAASLFGAVDLAPRDPILGVTEAFNSDPNPRKVNLGVGVYCDDNGKVPLLDCVKRAEREMTDKAAPRSYLPIDGIPAYDSAVQALLLGADSEARRAGPRGHRAGARRHRRTQGRRRLPAQVRAWRAGVDQRSELGKPPRAVRGARASRSTRIRTTTPRRTASISPAMRAVARSDVAAARSSCCTRAATTRPASIRHPRNGTRSSTIVRARGLVPFLDLAYQGFGDGIDADGVVVRKFAATPGPLFISSSFSKSFSLYGERVGALTVVTADKDEAARVLSQVKRVVRANYSNPPTHGGADRRAWCSPTPELRAMWESGARRHARAHREMRESLVEKLARARARARFRLRAQPARHVLVFGTHQGAGAAAARGVLDLRRRHGPHLRRGAQLAGTSIRRRRDRDGARASVPRSAATD